LGLGDFGGIMPIHEYECEVCSHIIEKLYMPGEETPEEIVEICPLAGLPLVFHKVISVSSFRLKGTGWAFDGYENRPWGKKPYHRAVKEDGYVPGSYIKTGKAEFKEEDSSGN
jgi:predicted nucleic acid-binding Zn ribbon protein